MNLLIFFIIILTIILIVCYYNVENKNSASLILALPLLGAMQYMNTKEECYNTREREYLKKRGIMGSNDEDDIKKLEDENIAIINLISQYDSLPELDIKFNSLKIKNKEFNDLNKYFLFKVTDNIIDPKILNELGGYFKDITINSINQKFVINTGKPVSEQNKKKAGVVIQHINDSNLADKNSIKGAVSFINTMLSINASENKMKDCLAKYTLYEKHLKNYKNKLYNINDIKYFKEVTDIEIKDIDLSSKQLKYLINIQQIIRSNTILLKYDGKELELNNEINKLKKDYNDAKPHIIDINKLIYSLFILYNVNLNKINNIKDQKYKNITKESFSAVLVDLKKKLNVSEVNKNQGIFNSVLAELLTSKREKRPMVTNNISVDLLSDIRKFNKIKLNKKLQEAIIKFENDNQNDSTLDEISIINDLISKYKELDYIYIQIALCTIYITQNDQTIDKKCYGHISSDTSVFTFDNIISKLNEDELHYFIETGLKNAANYKIYRSFITEFLAAKYIYGIDNTTSIYSIIIKNNKQDFDNYTDKKFNNLKTDIFKLLVPYYKYFFVKKYREHNYEINNHIIKYSTIYNKFNLNIFDNIFDNISIESIESIDLFELIHSSELLKSIDLPNLIKSIEALQSYKSLKLIESYGSLKPFQSKELVRLIDKINLIDSLKSLKLIDLIESIKSITSINIQCIGDKIAIIEHIKTNIKILNGKLNTLKLQYELMNEEKNRIQQQLNDVNVLDNESLVLAIESLVDDIGSRVITDDNLYRLDENFKNQRELLKQQKTLLETELTQLRALDNSKFDEEKLNQLEQKKIDLTVKLSGINKQLNQIESKDDNTKIQNALKLLPTGQEAAKQVEEAANEEAILAEAARLAEKEAAKQAEEAAEAAKQEAAKQAAKQAEEAAEAAKQVEKAAKQAKEAAKQAEEAAEAAKQEAAKQEAAAQVAARLAEKQKELAQKTQMDEQANATLIDTEDNAKKAIQAEQEAKDSAKKAKEAKEASDFAIAEAEAAQRDVEEANKKVIELEDIAKKYAELDAIAVKAEEALLKAKKAENIKKDTLDKAKNALDNANTQRRITPARKKQLQDVFNAAENDYIAAKATTENAEIIAKEARTEADLIKGQLESMIKNLIGKNPNLNNGNNNGTTINYSDEERKKIIEYKNNANKINDELIKMIISTDPEFKKYTDDTVRYNYLNLLQDKEPIILKDILDTIKVYENTILNEFIPKTKAYITNTESNTGIYKIVLTKKIYDIGITEYNTNSIYDSDGEHNPNIQKQKSPLYVFGTMINIILNMFTTEKEKKDYKEKNIKDIINICQRNNDIYLKLSKILSKDQLNYSLDNFYNTLEINNFNNLDLIKTNFERFKNIYNDVNFKNCDELLITSIENKDRGKNLEELINITKDSYNKKNKNLDKISTKTVNGKSVVNSEDMATYAENFGKIDYIRMFICISKYINQFNLELFKEYLSNKKRIELYEQLLPFEKYINLHIADLRSKITELKKNKTLNTGEIKSLKEKLEAAEVAKGKCDSSLLLQITELEKIKKILNDRLTNIETSLKITNDKKKELDDQKDEIEIRLDAVKALIGKENDNNDKLKSKIVALNQTLTKNTEAIYKLEATNKKLDTDSSTIQGQITFINGQIDTAKTSNARLMAKKETLQAELGTATSNNSKLEQESSDIQGQIKTIQEQLAVANVLNGQLTTEQKTLQDKLEATNKKLETELGSNKNLIAENQNTSERLTSIEQKISEDIKSAIKAREVVEAEVERIKRDLESKEAQYSNDIKELNKTKMALRIQLILYKKRYNDCQSNHNKYVTNTNNLIKDVNNLLNKIHGNISNDESNKDDFESIKIKLEDTISKLENNKESLDKIVDDIKNIVDQNPNFTDENVVEEMKKTNDKIILVTNDIIFRILVTLIKTVKDKDQKIKDLEGQLKTQKDQTTSQAATYSTNLSNKDSEIYALKQEHQKSLEKLNIDHQQKIEELTRELEQSKQNDITNKTNTLTSEYNGRLTELTAEYEKNLSTLNEQLEQEKLTSQSYSKDLKEKTKQIEQLKMSLADLEEQIQLLNNKHRNELNEVDTRYNTYKTDLESKHAEALQKISNSQAELNTTYMADKTEQTTLIANLEAEKTALIAKLEADKEKIIAKFESEKAELIIKHNAEKAYLEADKTELNTEKTRLISEHNAEKTQLESSHAKALQLLSSTKDTEKEQLISEHKTTLQGVGNESSSLYLKLKTDCDNEFNNLKQAYNTQTQLLKQGYGEKLEKIRKTCTEETDAKLRKQKEELEQQYNTNKQLLKEKLDQQHKETLLMVKEDLEQQYNNNLTSNNKALEQQHEQAIKTLTKDLELKHKIASDAVIADYEQKIKNEVKQERINLEEAYQRKLDTINRTHKNSIKSKEDGYEQKLSKIQAAKFKLEQQIQDNKKLNDDKTTSLTADSEEKINKLKTEYQSEIEKLNINHKKDLDILKTAQSTTANSILRGFSNTQETTHKKEINDLELEHANKLDELNKKYQSEIKQIKMKCSITKRELDNDILSLQTELSERSLRLSDSIINKGKENDKLQEEVDGYKRITSKMTDQILNLEYKKVQLDTDISELKAAHKLEIENLNMKYEEEQVKENKNYQDSINILSDKIVYLNKNILKLKNDIISLSEANSNYQMNISELSTKIELLNTENAAYKESKSSLNQNNNDLKNTIISLETINKQYENDIKELKSKMGLSKVSSDMVNENILTASLKNRKEYYEKIINELNISLEKIKGDYKKQIEELKQVHEKEIDNLKQTKSLSADLATSYISTGLNNTIKTRTDIENEYNNKLTQLKEKHKNDINQYQMNISDLESFILNLQNINKQLKTENNEYKNKLENEIKDRNILEAIISDYLQKYEDSSLGLKDTVLDIYKSLKPGEYTSKENVINTKLYMILERHKQIINELNDCKSLGKLGMQEIIKLIKKVKNNLVDKLVVNIDDIDSIDLNNIKFDKDQAKYLNKLDELLNKLIEEKFNLAKENKDLQEINDQLTDEYMVYIKDKETKIEKLNTEITEQTNIIKELNDNIDNITTEYINKTNNLTSKEFNEQIKILKTNINIKNALIKEKEDKLNKIEKEYKVQIELLKEENTTLQSKCDADKFKYEREINMLKRAYAKEQSKLNATIAKYDQYYTLTENDKKDINSQIIKENARIESIFTEKNDKLEYMNTLIDKFNFDLKNIQLQLTNCLDGKKILEQDILKIKSDKAAIENENQTIKASLEDNLFNVEKLKKENNELKKVINEMQAKCNKSSNNEVIYEEGEDIYIYIDKNAIKPVNTNKYRESGQLFTLDGAKKENKLRK